MNKEELIKKWLDNELSLTEREELEKLDGFKDYQKIIASAPYFKAPQFESEKIYKQIQEQKKQSSSSKKWIATISKIAAVLIIGFLSYTVFFKNTNQEFNTQLATTEHIILPDNSSVELNADSYLSFNENSWQENRNVTLNGEAFFKVAKGQKFTVKTPNGQVSVKGTQFNVKQRDNLFIVTCYEGLVEVINAKDTLLVAAGNEYSYVQNSSTFKDINLQKPSWTVGKTSFSNIPLKEVLNELERQYNIKVNLKNLTFDTDQNYTGSFVHHHLEEALKAITIPFNLTYKIDDRSVTIIKSE